MLMVFQQLGVKQLVFSINTYYLMFFNDSVWWFSSCEVLTFILRGETILQHCYSIRMRILFILKEHHSDCKYEPVPVGVGRPRRRDPLLTDKLAVSRWAMWSEVQMFAFASAVGVNTCPCSPLILVDLLGREREREKGQKDQTSLNPMT